MIICSTCDGQVESEVDEEGWTHWSCPCGGTYGIAAPFGELDLGISARMSDLMRRDQFHVFEESFDSHPVEEPVDVAVGEVVEQEP